MLLSQGVTHNLFAEISQTDLSAHMCCKFQFKMADGQRCVVLGVYMLETRLSKQSQHSHANYCSNIFSHPILTWASGMGARLGLRSISTLFFWGVFSDVTTSHVTEVFSHFFYFLFLLYLCKYDQDS